MDYDQELEPLRHRRRARRFAQHFRWGVVASMYLAVIWAWMHQYEVVIIFLFQARVLGLCAHYIKSAVRGMQF